MRFALEAMSNLFVCVLISVPDNVNKTDSVNRVRLYMFPKSDCDGI